MKAKKPVVAWLILIDGCDNAGLVGARTEAGARGFARHAAAGPEDDPVAPADFFCDLQRLGALDHFVTRGLHKPGVCWDLQIAMYQDQDARQEALRAALAATFAGMRKDGQGLTSDQEATVRRGLGL